MGDEDPRYFVDIGKCIFCETRKSPPRPFIDDFATKSDLVQNQPYGFPG